MTQYQELFEYLSPDEINAGSISLDRNGFNKMSDVGKSAFLDGLRMSASVVQHSSQKDKDALRVLTILIAVAGHSLD